MFVFFFISPVEVAVSDTLNSSTTKTTHFKGSEDGAGDLMELKDRRKNFGLFYAESKRRGRQDWWGEESSQG